MPIGDAVWRQHGLRRHLARLASALPPPWRLKMKRHRKPRRRRHGRSTVRRACAVMAWRAGTAVRCAKSGAFCLPYLSFSRLHGGRHCVDEKPCHGGVLGPPSRIRGDLNISRRRAIFCLTRWASQAARPHSSAPMRHRRSSRILSARPSDGFCRQAAEILAASLIIIENRRERSKLSLAREMLSSRPPEIYQAK